MDTIRRFAPLLAILTLFVLIALGGAALANNNATPDIDPATATLNVEEPSPTVPVPGTSRPTGEEPGTVDSAGGLGEQPAVPTPVPAPLPAPAPAPQPPLYYQDLDDGRDDDWDDDDGDDDWDDD